MRAHKTRQFFDIENAYLVDGGFGIVLPKPLNELRWRLHPCCIRSCACARVQAFDASKPKPCPRPEFRPRFPSDGRKIVARRIIRPMLIRRATCSHNVILSTLNTRAPSLNHYMTSSGPSRGARAFSSASNRPATLPRLPVPDLHQTLSKYLRSLVPLLQEDEVRGGPSWQSAFQERQRWADEFERGLGAKCQERLHGKFEREKVAHFLYRH
jgi:hypothetical protein